MPSLAAAERRQAKRDKEALKFIEDFEANRIDEWGNPITRGPIVEAKKVGSDSLQLSDLTNVVVPDGITTHSSTSHTPLQIKTLLRF